LTESIHIKTDHNSRGNYYLISSGDADTGKILCMAYAPKSAIDKGLKSNEWCGSVLGLINGKGGGKADNAQASGTNVAALRPAMEAAESYALGKLGVPRVQLKTAASGSSGDAAGSGTKAAAGAVVRGPAQSAGVQLVQVCAKYAGSALSFQPAGSFSFQVA
jgi:hypothetical protein